MNFIRELYPYTLHWSSESSLITQIGPSKKTRDKKKYYDVFRPETELPSSNENKCLDNHYKFGLQWVFWTLSKASLSVFNTG